jgi:hypothetical protein
VDDVAELSTVDHFPARLPRGIEKLIVTEADLKAARFGDVDEMATTRAMDMPRQS